MKTDSSSIGSNTNENLASAKIEEKSCQLLEFFDWSSTYDINDASSEQSAESLPKFKPISPAIYKKASRKWLSQNSQNFYSQAKSTVELSKDQVLAGKVLQAFENYLAIVTMMYYGDPFSKSKEASEALRLGKRNRVKQVADPLSMLVSPLRAEHEFGKAYAESWSPKEIAIFESCLCTFGKKVEVIQKLLTPAKAAKDITRFYYLWKKTSHYKAWKDCVRESMYKNPCG